MGKRLNLMRGVWGAQGSSLENRCNTDVRAGPTLRAITGKVKLPGSVGLQQEKRSLYLRKQGGKNLQAVGAVQS